MEQKKNQKVAGANTGNAANLLLDISKLISKIRNREELFDALMNSIKPVFNFTDSAIFVIDKDRQHYRMWHDTLSIEFTQGTASKEGEPISIKDNPVADDVFLMPIHIVTKKEMLISAANSPSIQKWIQESGTEETLICPLIVGGLTIGCFNCHASKRNVFAVEDFDFYQAVAGMLALAIFNIIANEEILEREREKGLLLTLSQSLSNIKGVENFWPVIGETIRSLVDFDDLVVITMEEDGYYRHLLTMSPHSRIENEHYQEIVHKKLPIKDTPFEYLFNKPDIFQWNLKELLALYPTYPGLLLMQETNLNYTVAINLKNEGEVFGQLYFHYENQKKIKNDKFDIYLAIGEQIAATVSNLLANEEILEREQEKSNLLSISEELASIRNKDDLFTVIFSKLKPIFHFDDAVVVKYSSDLEFTEHIVTTKNEQELKSESYKLIKSQKVPVKNTPYEEVLKFKEPKIIDLSDWMMKYPDHLGIKVVQDLGIKESVFMPLIYGSQLIGTFEFHAYETGRFSWAQMPLYHNLSNQIATALSNIIANEELETKAEEIKILNDQLKAQNAYLIEEVTEEYNFEEMIGQNKQFQEACNSIGLVAKTDSTVLILGETGTGKELVARAIHNISPRKNKPLIKINCAALPASLIESELFGHERGAFTGAIEKRIGKFELAHGSTLFLDEVGELPLELQAKLLRALQEKEIERLGSNKTIQIDVRIIAATNRDLVKEVKEGKFRQDLYYRLHIFPLTLPPLRERKEDLPLLASHFIQKYSKKMGKNIQGLSHKAIEDMMSYSWPGNIRELEHIIERSIILCKTKLIQDLHLPLTSKNRITASPNEFVVKTWEEQERDYILEVLKVTKGNMAGKGGAAELLQLPPATLQSKMKKLGIKRMHYVEKSG